jgi:hypothetical protein
LKKLLRVRCSNMRAADEDEAGAERGPLLEGGLLPLPLRDCAKAMSTAASMAAFEEE